MCSKIAVKAFPEKSGKWQQRASSTPCTLKLLTHGATVGTLQLSATLTAILLTNTCIVNLAVFWEIRGYSYLQQNSQNWRPLFPSMGIYMGTSQSENVTCSLLEKLRHQCFPGKDPFL